MRTLSRNEIVSVNGGIAPLVAIAGTFVLGAIASWAIEQGLNALAQWASQASAAGKVEVGPLELMDKMSEVCSGAWSLEWQGDGAVLAQC